MLRCGQHGLGFKGGRTSIFARCAKHDRSEGSHPQAEVADLSFQLAFYERPIQRLRLG